jgi:hypothetical protein
MRSPIRLASPLFALALSALAIAACSANGDVGAQHSNGGAGGSAGSAGSGGDDGGAGFAGAGGGSLDASTDGSGGGGQIIPDPTTCQEAANGHTYLGCDFWPTVTDNIVVSSFDFTVVVGNTGTEDAQITVTRGGQPVTTAVAPAGGLVKIYLPWVDELKSSASILPGCPTNVQTATVAAKGGAYHLVSTRPVAVYQFNPLEYAGKGGPQGKDWTFCEQNNCFGLVPGCFSFTNDASLLLPSTALTGNYRVAGVSPWTDSDPNSNGFTYPAYFAVTGTQDGTQVTVHVSATGGIAAGGGVPATPAGGTATFSLDAGDVVMVVGTSSADLSGSLVNATKPVQVIAGISCTQMPHGTEACDHVEENVLPVETLGKHYFVTRPTGPNGTPDTHIVRIYGNVDGTQLTYPGGNPGGPTTINAGDFVEIPSVSQDFEIVGDHEFTVASFMHGAGPNNGAREGDPSHSFMTTVEQYRLKYVFLAPDDYDSSYADVVAPANANLKLDGAPVTATPTPISSGYSVVRINLTTNTGAHVLEADQPVGLQVLGYGAYTSYQYPGGLNLGHISPPPVK